MKTKENPDEDKKPQQSNRKTSLCTKIKQEKTAFQSLIVPVWIQQPENPEAQRLVYAVLDDKSDTTFVKEKTLEELGVRGEKTQLSLTTMHAEGEIVDTCKIKGLVVRDYDRQVSIVLPRSFSRRVIPAHRSQIPRPESAKEWPNLEHIANQLMPYRDDIDIGLLIGLDCTRALILREVVPGDNQSPYAVKTDLGWGIIGKTGDTDDESSDELDYIGASHRIISREIQVPSVTTKTTCYFSFKTRAKEVINPLQVQKMFEMDFSEIKTNREFLSYDERKFIRKMQDGITQRPDGHYQMPLPFREEDPKLPNNKMLAIHRMKGLQVRMDKDEDYRQKYNTAMDEVLTKGYAEKVPDVQKTGEEGKVWYIPHHGVFHPKKTEKLRVVYDCSSKFKGVSLNNNLLPGPDLTNTLLGVLCRFRKEPFAFICDIEGMFHQFKVNKEHRDFLRFLWWENGDTRKTPEDYRMTVHLFGATSSPACSSYGLKKTADDYEKEFGPDVANFIRYDFYVDDGLKSLPTEEQAIQKSKQMCSRGGLKLHKFISNSKNVIESIPLEDRAKCLKDLDLRHNVLLLERALGMQWCVENDMFQFRIVMQDKPLTRRGILSTISSVFDPLGFIAPVTLTGKQILQDLTRDKLDWDEPLSDTTRTRWEKWRSSLSSLEQLPIERCYKPSDFGELKSVELHHFSDASIKGYGQCSYLRLVNVHEQVHCSFVMGKARVTPLKAITVPRLLRQELEYSKIKETFWTDSSVVLGYINNDAKRFYVFAANRVQQIRDCTDPDQWKFVNSSSTPADAASRGLNAEDLKTSQWLRGPQYLWQRDLPQSDEENDRYIVSEKDPEMKRAQVHSIKSSEKSFPTLLERLNYFSDWYRAKKAVTICLKFKEKLRSHLLKLPQQPLSVDDLQRAEQIIIKEAQQGTFGGDNALRRLDPFTDKEGVLRVGGRIKHADASFDVKHPIILPRKGHITYLIVKYYHERIKHKGRGITLNALRSSGYWIIGGSSAVGNYIRNCVDCRKLRSKAEEQKMGDLPPDRVDPEPPFTFCAVDFFGPWYIKKAAKS